MSSARRLFGAAGIYTAANIANAAIPFFLLPVLTRVLSPADYGILAMFGIMVTVLGAFTGLGTHGAIGVRYFQLDAASLSRYVGACLLILVASTAALSVLVVAARSWLVAFTQIPVEWLLVAVLVAAAQFIVNVRLSLWQVKGRPLAYGAFQILQSATNATLSLLFILWVGMAWEGRALGQALAVGGFMLLGLCLLWKSGEIARPRAGDHVQDALRFGIPLIPHLLGSLLIVTIDRFMISNMLDVAHTGIYMVALQLGMVLGLATESFNKAYAPWLMAELVKDDAARDRKIVRGTYLYFVAVCLAALAYAAIAPLLIAVLVGEEFQQAAGVVGYIAFGFAFGGMYFMVTNYLFFSGKTASLAVVTLAAGLVNVAATYALIRANGLVGAAQAFMLSQAILFLGTWWMAQRAHPMPWRRALLSAS